MGRRKKKRWPSKHKEEVVAYEAALAAWERIAAGPTTGNAGSRATVERSGDLAETSFTGFEAPESTAEEVEGGFQGGVKVVARTGRASGYAQLRQAPLPGAERVSYKAAEKPVPANRIAAFFYAAGQPESRDSLV